MRPLAFCILVCLFASGSTYSQEHGYTLSQYLADWKHHDGYFVQEVVSVQGKSSDEIFTVCAEWMEQQFQTSEEFEQVVNRETGTLIAKGWKWFSDSLIDSGHMLWATVKIEVRDGRFRYTIYDVYTDMADSDFDGLENEFNLERRVDDLYRKDGSLRGGAFKSATMDVFDALQNYRMSLGSLTLASINN